MPIYDQLGHKVAFYWMAISDESVFGAARERIAAVLLWSLFVLAIGAWFIVRKAQQYTGSITELTGEIYNLAEGLHGKYAQFRDEPSPIRRLPYANEVASLSVSVELLGKEIHQAEKIEKVIQVERERSQTE
jgi:hypothetical protein